MFFGEGRREYRIFILLFCFRFWWFFFLRKVFFYFRGFRRLGCSFEKRLFGYIFDGFGVFFKSGIGGD